MTSRGTANVLTRTTAILAGLFFVTSLICRSWPAWGRAADLDHAGRRPADRAGERAGRAAAAEFRRWRPQSITGCKARPTARRAAPRPSRGAPRCRSRN